METNRASGSQQPAENADENPSGVHEHTTRGRAATNSHDVNNGLTPNTSDNTDPGTSDPIITSQEYKAMVARLFQDPFTPDELLAAQSCVLPSSFNPETLEDLAAIPPPNPSIRQIITQMAIDHKTRFKSCGSAKLNSNINVPSTASASSPLKDAPEAPGPASLGQLYHPAASPAGHQLAGSNIGNPDSTPRLSRLALGVPVGPPIVSQETCNGARGRGGCNSLVWQPGARRCLDHIGRCVAKDTPWDVKARHALGIWCCTHCYTGEVGGPSTHCLRCRSKRQEYMKRRNASASNDSGDGTQNDETGEDDAEYPPEGASNSNSLHNPLGIGSSSTPVTMPGIPQVQPPSNFRSGPDAFQPSNTTGHSISSPSPGSGDDTLPSAIQNYFGNLLHLSGQIAAPTLAQGPSGNESSSAGLPAHSSSSAQQSEDQDQGYNSHDGHGSQ